MYGDQNSENLILPKKFCLNSFHYGCSCSPLYEMFVRHLLKLDCFVFFFCAWVSQFRIRDPLISISSTWVNLCDLTPVPFHSPLSQLELFRGKDHDDVDIVVKGGKKRRREKITLLPPGKGECAFHKGKSCSLNLVQCAHGVSFWNEKVNNLSINDIVGWYGFLWNSNPCQIQTFVKGKNWTNIQCRDVPAQLSSPIVRWLYSKSTPNQGHRHKPSASVTGVPRNLLRPIFGLLVRPAAQHKGLEAAQGRRASRKINNFPPICQPPKKTLSPTQVF